MFTERLAIQQRIQEIKEERRELREEYYQLLDRLRELDTGDNEGVDFNELTTKLSEAVTSLSQITHVPAIEVIKYAAQQLNENNLEVKEEKEEIKPVAEHSEIARQKDKDNKFDYKTNDLLRELTIEVLNEAGTPLKTSDIRERVSSKYGKEVDQKSFYNIVQYLVDQGKINKAFRGHYQV